MKVFIEVYLLHDKISTQTDLFQLALQVEIGLFNNTLTHTNISASHTGNGIESFTKGEFIRIDTHPVAGISLSFRVQELKLLTYL